MAHRLSAPILILAAAALACVAPSAAVRAAGPVEAPARPGVAPIPPAPTATGKERLSDKASDAQRENDCGVPPERRGPGPRPTENCRR